MRLYLVQHGDSLPKEVDPDRPLSPQGRKDVEQLAAFLKGRVRVARILHSGKTRARQTAELLAAAVAESPAIDTISGIDPLDPPEPLASKLHNWNEDALIVGHQPFMGKLVARLIVGAEEPGIVTFQPGTLVCLERALGARWAVIAMLRPELLVPFQRFMPT
ncbi:MAG: phosphohistidine phosphatase SixA [Betaproteobacteria bacterium RIFCSPLOWO2_12_FULL_62_13]|nr:MAG: phosphohistidine phosphatase SixA [Betaproteobacteria bacterium RIFCSPLOWO2_12_FULL_62_13]